MRIASLSLVLFLTIASATTSSCGDDPRPSQTPPVQTESDAEVKLGIGNRLREAGRFDEALGLFEQILKDDPNNEKAQFNRATVWTDLGRLSEALVVFDRLLGLHPTDPEVLTNRGVVLMQLGRNEEALDSTERALAIAPSMVQTRMLRAQVLTKLLRYDDAFKELDVAKGIQPNAVEVEFVRAEVLTAQGNGAGAEAVYADLLLRYPGVPRLKAEIDARRAARK